MADWEEWMVGLGRYRRMPWFLMLIHFIFSFKINSTRTSEKKIIKFCQITKNMIILDLNQNIQFKRVRVSINLHISRKIQILTWMVQYPASAWWLYVYVMLPRLCTCVYRSDRVGVHGRRAFYFRHCSVHFPHFLNKNLVKLFYHKRHFLC